MNNLIEILGTFSSVFKYVAGESDNIFYTQLRESYLHCEIYISILNYEFHTYRIHRC